MRRLHTAGAIVTALLATPACLAESISTDIEVQRQVMIAKVVKDAADQATAKLQTSIEEGASGADLAKEIFAVQQSTIAHCGAQANVLQAKLDRIKKSHVRTGAIGKLVALIGAVTVHPASKTVLMGIGISGSDNNSVLGLFADYSAEEADALKAQIAAVKAQFTAQLDAYAAIAPSEDPTGLSRKNALLRAKATCDGLVDHPVPSPDAPASASDR